MEEDPRIIASAIEDERINDIYFTTIVGVTSGLTVFVIGKLAIAPPFLVQNWPKGKKQKLFLSTQKKALIDYLIGKMLSASYLGRSKPKQA